MKFIKLVLLIRSLLQGTKAFRKGQQHSISCTYLEQNLALKQTNINPIFVLGDVQIMNWSNFDSYNVKRLVLLESNVFVSQFLTNIDPDNCILQKKIHKYVRMNIMVRRWYEVQ